MNYRVSHKYSGQRFEEALAAQNKIEIPFNSIRCTLQGVGCYTAQRFAQNPSPPTKIGKEVPLAQVLLLLRIFPLGLLCSLTTQHNSPASNPGEKSLSKGSHCPFSGNVPFLEGTVVLSGSLPRTDAALLKASHARLDVHGRSQPPLKTPSQSFLRQ